MNNFELYDLFKSFISELLPKIKNLTEKATLHDKHKEYPKLFLEKGIPILSEYWLDAPINISALLLNSGNKPLLNMDECDSFLKLNQHLFSLNEFRDLFYPNEIATEGQDSYYSSIITVYICNIFERYYHLSNGTTQFDIGIFDKIYKSSEAMIYSKKLHFDFSIPLLMISFSDDEIKIDKNILIRKISKENHMARYYIRSHEAQVPDHIISMCTHELVFKNYSFPSNKIQKLSYSPEFYPLDIIELFFNAVKIINDFSTGFSQILIYPHDWAGYYKMDLPYMLGLTIRKYPQYFDRYFYDTDLIKNIDTDEAVQIAKIYRAFLNTDHNKILIANKRLRTSYLRDNDEDSILDIVIALEALLGGNDKGELVHKLALRVAALFKKFDIEKNSFEVFTQVKKIYNFRSKLIHGNTKLSTNKLIQGDNTNGSLNEIRLANDFLRKILKILIENEQLLDPSKIDKLLLE
ncbi:MAG TPA: HEPN domain-containing protein [Bacteroidia bacterium]|nr:HEPN domain-containing protein [Bacteroidia bacterium]